MLLSTLSMRAEESADGASHLPGSGSAVVVCPRREEADDQNSRRQEHAQIEGASRTQDSRTQPGPSAKRRRQVATVHFVPRPRHSRSQSLTCTVRG